MMEFVQDPVGFLESMEEEDELKECWLYARDPNNGNTALHNICIKRDDDMNKLTRHIISMLRHKAPLSVTNLHGETPLMACLRWGETQIANFLLSQRVGDFQEVDLQRCLKEAQKLCVNESILSGIRMREGTKYSREVPQMVRKVTTCRVVGQTLSQSMSNQEIHQIGRIEAERCNSELFRSLKSQVSECFDKHRPFSDDVLMGVCMHARSHHPSEWKQLKTMILNEQKKCVGGDKQNMLFLWFEEFVAHSTVCARLLL